MGRNTCARTPAPHVVSPLPHCPQRCAKRSQICEYFTATLSDRLSNIHLQSHTPAHTRTHTPAHTVVEARPENHFCVPQHREEEKEKKCLSAFRFPLSTHSPPTAVDYNIRNAALPFSAATAQVVVSSSDDPSPPTPKIRRGRPGARDKVQTTHKDFHTPRSQRVHHRTWCDRGRATRTLATTDVGTRVSAPSAWLGGFLVSAVSVGDTKVWAGDVGGGRRHT
jgi:hypothetical protein